MIPENDKRVIAMRKLGYSDFQIEEMLEDDKAIDRGEIMEWDLSAEEHKKAIKYANADEHKKPAETAEKKTSTTNAESKKRKENPTKEKIIAAVAQFLTETADLSCQNVEIVNKQGKIAFIVDGNSLSFALTQHKKK